MTHVAIRPVQPADIPHIAAIYGHAVQFGTASFELKPPGEAEMARRIGTLVDTGYPYLVAVIGDDIAGFAYAGPYRPRVAYHNTVEDSVYVSPSAQRRGVGQALLAQLIVDCETLGFRQMLAVIGDSGNVGSIKVHANAGFTHCGTFASVGYKFGRWLDTVQMQRQLGVGADLEPKRTAPARD